MKHQFTVPKFPDDKDNYVKVVVQRFSDHYHEAITDKVNQIRGATRAKVAQEIINDGSSAHNYYKNE